MDNLVIEMSLAAGVDISPCLEFWGWTLTGKVSTRMEQEGLEPYLFENYITETVSPSRRDVVLQKHPDINRQVSHVLQPNLFD